MYFPIAMLISFLLPSSKKEVFQEAQTHYNIWKVFAFVNIVSEMNFILLPIWLSLISVEIQVRYNFQDGILG